MAVYQPRYLPCLHWWNRLVDCDVFVVFDDAQFKRQSWQHRARLVDGGLLTVPVSHSTLFGPINRVRVAGERWRRKHLGTLRQLYGKEAFFDRFESLVAASLGSEFLFGVTGPILFEVARLFGLERKIRLSSDLGIRGLRGTDWLVEICRRLGADSYVAGGTGFRSYLEVDKFADAGIDLVVQDWECKYPYGDISIIDPLMRYGEGGLEWIA